MQVTEYFHTAILVTNLEKSEYFYGEILGLKKIERVLKFPGIWYEIGKVQIHLIVVAEVPVDRVDEEKWGRNRHLALRVESLENAKEKLLSCGCKFQMSASGRPALFTEDPDGNIIELSE